MIAPAFWMRSWSKVVSLLFWWAVLASFCHFDLLIVRLLIGKPLHHTKPFQFATTQSLQLWFFGRPLTSRPMKYFFTRLKFYLWILSWWVIFLMYFSCLPQNASVVFQEKRNLILCSSFRMHQNTGKICRGQLAMNFPSWFRTQILSLKVSSFMRKIWCIRLEMNSTIHTS